jgi:hypothetical protein
MKKLRLEVDELRVDSFDTDAGGASRRGTVAGQLLAYSLDQSGCEIYSGCCTQSCNGTCDATCADTCWQTCKYTCICPSAHYTECNCAGTYDLSCTCV